jgi:RimJ/RimL family protein N-acetyltransferase
MVHGEKVLLRSLEREDLPALWAWNNDLETEVVGGGDPPMPQSLARLQAEFDKQASEGGRDNARFVIEADGKAIGHCGLFGWNAADGTCELGITIGDKAYWGHGYGRDAVRTLVEYAFRYRNQRRVFLRVLGTNERGIRAYRAAGFVEEGRQRRHVWSAGRYVDLVFMGVLREEWPGLAGEA